VKINKVKDEQDAAIKELKDEINVKAKAGQDTISLVQKLNAMVEASEDQKAIDYFKSLEDRNPDALALWQRFRDLSVQKYRETYKRLNIEFDEYAGESTVSPESIKAVAEELAEKKISEDSEGAVIVDFEKHGAKKLGKAILLRKDGTPLYLTRDIAEIRRRHDEHHFDKMIYVVASAQDLHLAQFFKVSFVDP
jgi:arginyl-tRNA synthetase